MFNQNLEQWVSKIQVRNMVNADVEVINQSPLVMMGKGRQGAVFKLTDDVCVKVFGNTEDCDREYYALSLGQQTSLFPKLYGKGSLYIAMEIIRGVDLREYLQSQPLTRTLSAKLIEMLITFKAIGYERIDHHKRQIYLQPDGSLKVIDVARTIWRDRVYPYPRKLLTSLGEENKAIFLSHVKEMAPTVYLEWLHYIRMEEISRQITAVLLSQSSESEKVKSKNKILLTTDDEKKYAIMLEGLVHKVFKEEWVKLMLARGADLDEIMEKIDEYWDQSELRAAGHSFESASLYEGERLYSGEHYHESGKRFEGDRGKRFEGDRAGHHHHGKRYEGERSPENDRAKGKKHDKNKKHGDKEQKQDKKKGKNQDKDKKHRK
jgi:predicted Ser/Thr protein kinase